MPEVNIEIGGRNFTVSCNDGEQPHLQQAAKMLSREATELQSQIGRVPESRMLLMAGLMLADRFKEMNWDTKTYTDRIADLERQLRASDAKLSDIENAPAPKENAAPASFETLEAAISRLEKLADQLESGQG